MKSRKDKNCWKLWLTEGEERLLKEILKKGVYSIAWTIMRKAYKRGDLENGTS